MSKDFILHRIAVVGCTATGKTAVSVEVASRLKAEIISADSMQIWRGMDVGTAKPTPEEQSRVRFHLIDVAEFDESFSVAEFQILAEKAMDDISSRGNSVIVSGGTGLFVKAVVDGVRFPPEAAEGVRDKIRSELKEAGAEALYTRLKEVDPAAADRISRSDTKRIVRALEVWETTGRTISSFIEEDQRARKQTSWRLFGLSIDTQVLNRRIDARVEKMMADGLVEETSRLMKLGLTPEMQSAKALGYKEVMAYINGECSLDVALEMIKRNTRRYAKRQRTWFRADSRITWLDATERGVEELADEVVHYLNITS